MKKFSHVERSAAIKDIAKQKFDLLVIGGGINGAGVARDAALRGMKVALVEMNDFAEGTSSRSSKLIHGGIRYLENQEFKLVFEALSERAKLFEMAPHLAHPLRFLIPIYESSRVSYGLMKLGMWLYDALSLFQAPELHESLKAKQTMERLPELQSKGLKGSVVYSDAYMDDDRLVIETLRSANEAGAVCLNYIKAKKILKNSTSDRFETVVCENRFSDSGIPEEFKIQARHIVSAVGVWTDELNSDLKIEEKFKPRLRPTKGVHLTFRRDRVPLSCAVVMGAEKRIVFGIPRHEMVIIGTTDTDYTGNLEEVRATDEDVRYLLKVTQEYFPGLNITSKDIVATYAGIRPLVKDESDSEGKTSREHTIFTLHDQVTFVAGGKYTTYRLMAEQVVDECIKYFSIEERARWSRCSTAQPLNFLINSDSRRADDLLFEELREQVSMPDEDLRRLIDRHSVEAREMIKTWKGFSYWEIEAAHAIAFTSCHHLVDFYTRRVPLVLSEVDHGLSKLDEILPIFQHYLGWSEKESQNQIQKLNKHLDLEFAWRHKMS